MNEEKSEEAAKKIDDENVRYNSDGEKLKYTGNGIWIPEGESLPPWMEESYVPPLRPKISVIAVILSVVIPVIIFLLLAFWLNSHTTDIGVFKIFLILISVYVFLRTKHILIFCILLYQRFAPAHIRQSCLFTPSCSNYAILALNKYGVIIGVIKTIGRLKRCRNTNGGEDYP